MTFFNDPNITDMAKISTTMASLRSLSTVLAYAFIGLLLPMEVIHQIVKTIEGKQRNT